MQELDSLFVEGSPVKVNFLNVLTAIKENYDFIYALSQSCCSDFSKLVRSFTLHALDDTPHAKEHIISDFQVPYKYGSRNFHCYHRICDCDLVRIRCERRANRNRDDHSQRLRLCQLELNSPTFSYLYGEGFSFGK